MATPETRNEWARVTRAYQVAMDHLAHATNRIEELLLSADEAGDYQAELSLAAAWDILHAAAKRVNQQNEADPEAVGHRDLLPLRPAGSGLRPSVVAREK